MVATRAIGIALFTWCAASGLSADGPDPRLETAVKTQDRAAVRTLLKNRAALNGREADGTTLLHWAVQADDPEIVRLLIAAGADASAANRYGVTPVALAATNGNAAILEALIRAGADANASLPEGQTVLMTAARTGNAEALDVLIRHGAAVNAKESWLGETALMWAAVENHAAAVRTLVGGGAEINARSDLQTYPRLTYPATGLVRMALPRGGWTALMYAARQGSLDAATALADAGADLNLTDPDGTPALLLAILNAHYDVAAMLVEHGADPNVADVTGKAALYTAIDARNAERLISRPVPRRDSTVDSLQFIQLLLARGSNPNARLSRALLQRQHNAGDAAMGAGSTPLMRAAKAGDVNAMRLLIDHGASLTLTQANGTTALMIAAGGGQAAPAEDEEIEGGGSASAAIEAIKLCLSQGVDINAVNDTGDTALHSAAAKGADSIIRFLVDNGAKLDAENYQGLTPLQVAIGSRRSIPDTVALLRELAAK